MKFSNVLSFAKVKGIIQQNGYMFYELYGFSDDDLNWHLIGDSPQDGKKDLPITELLNKLEQTVNEFEDVYNVFKIDLRKQHNHQVKKTFSHQFFTDAETFAANYKVTGRKQLGAARSTQTNGFSYNELEARQEEAYQKGYAQAEKDFKVQKELDELKRQLEDVKRNRAKVDNTEKWMQGLGIAATLIGIPIIQKVAPESMPAINAALAQLNATDEEEDDEEPI